MTIIDRVDQAIARAPAATILRFGVYQIIKRLGKGEQGGVYQLAHPIGKAFALKLYLPVVGVGMSEEESVANFIREVSILASINHKNIIGVKTAGYAVFDAREDKWIITEGLDKATDPNAVYFYVMNYLSRRLSDMFPVSRRDFRSGVDEAISGAWKNRRLDLFERVTRHICDAIIHCHRASLVHKDIKADNILFRDEDENFVLADFGFARHGSSPAQDPVIHLFENVDPSLILDKHYEANDIAEFAKVLRRILPQLARDYDTKSLKGIEDALRAATDHSHARFPVIDATAFKQSLEQYFTKSVWGFRLKTGDFLLAGMRNRFAFTSTVQIPVSGPVPLTDEVKRIIDLPDFQRLRGTRQLGPTFFVFPGAYHTRFEHSIGTYHFALRYLESLTRLSIFNDFATPVSETVRLITLAALLHDVGHYPYSHWIEELKPFPGKIDLPTHESRARTLLKHADFKKVIEDDWELAVDDVADVICGEHLTTGRKQVANSVIDSVLDVDKLDYLIRDSVHCGVTYGKALDPERLIEGLFLDAENNRVCLTQKGRSYLSSLLACRNIMYQEVYWHKTVRACTGMFKHFFYHYVSRKVDSTEAIKELFELPDDLFIATLVQRIRKKHADLLPLIAPFAFGGREIFKPAYIFSLSSKRELSRVSHFFRKLLDDKSYTGSVKAARRIAKKLKKRCPGITSLDLVIEKTPLKGIKEKYSYQSLRIWDTRKERFEDPPEKLDESSEYLEAERQAYIFCRPRFYEELRRMSPKEWAHLLDEVGGP
jgi:HD superfamily phosphohydrolase